MPCLRATLRSGEKTIADWSGILQALFLTLLLRIKVFDFIVVYSKGSLPAYFSQLFVLAIQDDNNYKQNRSDKRDDPNSDCNFRLR